ncbi:MAG: glycerol-3-phosphate responsive antiterminator [Acutalibacteraceae bacterium]|nr:glycerol-3-phosphate responsive antiterminator [Acutalibacteraceae bacterium]
MTGNELHSSLESCPIIATVYENGFDTAISSPPEIIFFLGANLLTVKQRIKEAHEADKKILIHIDLAEGIGKDKTGIEYLAHCGADGIISTRTQLIRIAKEYNLATVQRFFAYDTHGIESINEILNSSSPDIIEIMPGIIMAKVIERFRHGNIPLIAGGLIDTKSDVTGALSSGALAVSTGKQELWYI